MKYALKTKGLFQLKEPYNSMINNDEQYEIVYADTISNMAASGSNPLENVYKISGATEKEYNVDLLANVIIYGIVNSSGGIFYFPETSVLESPYNLLETYVEYGIGLNLGLLKKDIDLTGLQNGLIDYITGYLGIKPTFKIAPISYDVSMTVDKSVALEAERDIVKKSINTDKNKIDKLTADLRLSLERESRKDAYIRKTLKINPVSSSVVNLLDTVLPTNYIPTNPGLTLGKINTCEIYPGTSPLVIGNEIRIYDIRENISLNTLHSNDVYILPNSWTNLSIFLTTENSLLCLYTINGWIRADLLDINLNLIKSNDIAPIINDMKTPFIRNTNIFHVSATNANGHPIIYVLDANNLTLKVTKIDIVSSVSFTPNISITCHMVTNSYGTLFCDGRRYSIGLSSNGILITTGTTDAWDYLDSKVFRNTTIGTQTGLLLDSSMY